MHWSLRYWKVCVWFCFPEISDWEMHGSCEHAQSLIPFYHTNQIAISLPSVCPPWARSFLQQCSDEASWVVQGTGSSAERTRRTSISCPGLQVLLLSWVEGFSVSVEGSTLSRRNKGTQDTEGFVQKHISTLPLSQVCFDGGGWVGVHRVNL